MVGWMDGWMAASEQQQAREHHGHRNEPHSLAASLPLSHPPSHIIIIIVVLLV